MASQSNRATAMRADAASVLDDTVRAYAFGRGLTDRVTAMSNVIVVATFKVQEGRVDEAIAGLTPVIEQTHDEPGCLSYALHRDVNDPLTLVLVERWTSQVALESHFQQPYMEGLGQLAAELLSEPPTLKFCTPLAIGDDLKGTL